MLTWVAIVIFPLILERENVAGNPWLKNGFSCDA